MPKHENEQPSQTDVMVEMMQTLKALREQAATAPATEMTSIFAKLSDTMDAISKRADAASQTQRELMLREMPENKQSPGISAFSYPEGDLARPKPHLKCPMFWVGFPEIEETLLPEEIEALNSLQSGSYFVTKANGNRIPFTVTEKRTLNGKLEELDIRFPCKGEQSTDHRSKIDYCREAMGVTLPTMAEVMAELERTKQDLAALMA